MTLHDFFYYYGLACFIAQCLLAVLGVTLAIRDKRLHEHSEVSR